LTLSGGRRGLGVRCWEFGVEIRNRDRNRNRCSAPWTLTQNGPECSMLGTPGCDFDFDHDFVFEGEEPTTRQNTRSLACARLGAWGEDERAWAMERGSLVTGSWRESPGWPYRSGGLATGN